MAYTVVRGDTLSGIASRLGVSLAALEAANPMPNFNRIMPGQVINVPGQPAAGGGGTSDQQYQTALSEYGAIAVFAQNNPEVNAKLQEAIKNQWDAARFERELWTTNWYKSLSQNQRQLQVLQTTDPGQYNAQLGEKANEILVAAGQAGKQLSQAQATDLAQKALWGGWDNSVVQAHLGEDYGNTMVNGRFTGLAGDTENHVRTTLAAFGIPINDQYVTQQVNDIVAGKQTTGGFDNQVIGQATKLFPQYAQDFLEGRSLSDVAKPYVQQAASTLEIDPSTITLQDKNVLKALQGDGQNAMPLWQFNQMLKQDPRWQKTDNAKNAAYDTLAQIGKDWGFM